MPYQPGPPISQVSGAGRLLEPRRRLHHRTGRSFADLARKINPIVRGWMNYYGAFYKSALYCLLTRINAYLLRWVRNKYRRLRGRTKAQKAWIGVTQRYPRFFAHWAWVNMPPIA